MTISKGEFTSRFYSALKKATRAWKAEMSLDENAEVELHHMGKHIGTIAEANETLWLGTEKFFKVIDVSIHPKSADASKFFVRPSGHHPCAWNEVVGDDGIEPFHVMVPA